MRVARQERSCIFWSTWHGNCRGAPFQRRASGFNPVLNKVREVGSFRLVLSLPREVIRDVVASVTKALRANQQCMCLLRILRSAYESLAGVKRWGRGLYLLDISLQVDIQYSIFNGRGSGSQGGGEFSEDVVTDRHRIQAAEGFAGAARGSINTSCEPRGTLVHNPRNRSASLSPHLFAPLPPVSLSPLPPLVRSVQSGHQRRTTCCTGYTLIGAVAAGD